MFESQNPEKINIKDLSLDRPEKEGKTPEELREEFRDFLAETFLEWYSNNARIETKIPEAANHLPELIAPKDQNWQDRRGGDPSKFGEYTINTETIDIDWEAIPLEKIKSVKLLDDWRGKPIADVAEYVITTYGKDYYIPGIEFIKYLTEHAESRPQELKDNTSHFLFGSTLRDESGTLGVPNAWHIKSFRWRWGIYLLANHWFSSCRVILVEKNAVIKKPKDFLKPTPPMPEIRKF